MIGWKEKKRIKREYDWIKKKEKNYKRKWMDEKEKRRQMII